MATNLHRVLLNCAWRTAAVVPTNTTSPLRFEEYDPIVVPDPPDTSGFTRKFYWQWISSDEDVETTDYTRREAHHLLRLVVEYPLRYPWTAMQAMIVQDRHDLAKALRDQRNRLGYDDDHTTTDIGLYIRKRAGDKIDRNDHPRFWHYVADWRCKVREDE